MKIGIFVLRRYCLGENIIDRKKITHTALRLDTVPQVGQKVVIETPGSVPTPAEITEVVEKGQELWAVVKAAREDGKIEFAEILVIVAKATEVAGLSVWAKIGRFFRNLFRRK